jgi:hypothetical protein
MENIITSIKRELASLSFQFSQPPIVIGGMAMEYYGLRKSGADIDLVICNLDYQKLAVRYPDNRKDIYGDLGIIIESLEIWRSIALFDYDFLAVNAVKQNDVLVVSLENLLLMRVCAMEVQKYADDLKLIKEYYYSKFRNPNFLKEAEKHITSYEKHGGVIWGGKYQDE